MRKNFKDDIAKLAKGDSTVTLDYIVKHYGTHCSTGGDIGGVLTSFASMSKEDYSKAKSESHDFKADAKGNIEGIDLSSKKSFSLDKSVKTKNGNVDISWSVYAAGGDNADSKGAWMDSITEFPGIVSIQLTGLWALLNKNKFPDIPNIDEISNQFKGHIEQYLKDNENTPKQLKSGSKVRLKNLSSIGEYPKGYMTVEDYKKDTDRAEARMRQGGQSECEWIIYKVNDDDSRANRWRNHNTRQPYCYLKC